MKAFKLLCTYIILPSGITLLHFSVFFYAMSTQFCTTSLQRVWSLICHSRICEHDLTVTLTLLCTCTHCVNVTVFSSCMWSSHVTGFSVDPSLTAHRLQCMYRGPIQWGQTRCTSMYIVWSCGYHIHTHTHTVANIIPV